MSTASIAVCAILLCAARYFQQMHSDVAAEERVYFKVATVYLMLPLAMLLGNGTWYDASSLNGLNGSSTCAPSPVVCMWLRGWWEWSETLLAQPHRLAPSPSSNAKSVDQGSHQHRATHAPVGLERRAKQRRCLSSLVEIPRLALQPLANEVRARATGHDTQLLQDVRDPVGRGGSERGVKVYDARAVPRSPTNSPPLTRWAGRICRRTLSAAPPPSPPPSRSPAAAAGARRREMSCRSSPPP